MLIADLFENADDPLLVHLIERRLEKHDDVWMRIQVDKGWNRFKHAGHIISIGVLAMHSAELKKKAEGDFGIQISYAKHHSDDGYKGSTEVILPVDTFDKLYTLEKQQYDGHEVFMLVNASD